MSTELTPEAIARERERFNDRLRRFTTAEQKKRIKHYRNELLRGEMARARGIAHRVVEGVRNTYCHQVDQYHRLNAKLDGMLVPG